MRLLVQKEEKCVVWGIKIQTFLKKNFITYKLNGVDT